MDADVIVVGAGPTGLMLAGELALAGVGCVVLEKLAVRSGQSKALNLQPRSAEILHSRGLLDPLVEQAIDLVPSGHFAGLPVRLDYAGWDTRHPYQVGIPQARVEEFLEDRLPAPVLRGHKLVDLEQDADGVTAMTHDSLRLRGRYLVGCDGGRSAVRKLLNVPFPGRDGRWSGVVADVVLKGQVEMIPARWRLSLKPGSGGIVSVLPLADGVYRTLFTDPAGSPLDAPVTEAEVSRALRSRYGSRIELAELRWASRFTDATRQVERYRVDRVMLAGDAAHIHSPTGGQGLNLGLQDSFNLGWKLAAQVRGWAGEGLLDSYHAERHPVGARVLANTRAQTALLTPDEDVAALRDIVADLMRSAEANHYLTGMISGLDIRYDMPSSTAHALLGRRMPDVDLDSTDGPVRLSKLMRTGRGLLLELDDDPAFEDLAARWHPRIDHRLARPDPGLDARAVLIRPDGHVCWVDPGGDAGQPPHAALAHWFGPPAQ